MSGDGLEGRVAVVTGAGRGIGEAIAVELARCGASLVLAARTGSDLDRVAERIAGEGRVAHVVPTDVTDAASVKALVTSTEDRFGRLDVLVNNAGLATFDTVAESDPDAWWGVVEVNLKGTYLCTRAALPRLMADGGGHVVNIASIAAQNAFPASSAYCSAKAGVLMLTRVLAAEVRTEGVRVTAIIPGATNTPLWEGTGSDLDTSQMMPPERVAETVAFVVTQGEGAVTDEVLLLPPGGIL